MFAQLKAAVSAATSDPQLWPACVGEMSCVLGGAAVLLTLRPPLHGNAEWIATAAIAAQFVHAYAETYSARDPWVERLAAFPPGIRFGYELVPRWELLRSAFYEEWMVPQDLLPELSINGLILKRGGQPISTLAVFRRPGTRLLELEDIAVLRRLLPHLQHAVRSAGRRRHPPGVGSGSYA